MCALLVRNLSSIGLDGAVLIEVMRDRGVSTHRMEGYAQRLRRGEGGTGADLVRPRLLDFWQVRRRATGSETCASLVRNAPARCGPYLSRVKAVK